MNCVPIVNRENLLEQAKLGRIATHSPSAEARRSATQTKQFAAIRSWNPSELPSWLNEKVYRSKILPGLPKLTVKTICLAIGVSHPYATNIRRGIAIPHPRHWLALAKLGEVASIPLGKASPREGPGCRSSAGPIHNGDRLVLGPNRVATKPTRWRHPGCI